MKVTKGLDTPETLYSFRRNRENPKDLNRIPQNPENPVIFPHQILNNPQQSQGILSESLRVLRILGISSPILMETSYKVFEVSSPLKVTEARR